MNHFGFQMETNGDLFGKNNNNQETNFWEPFLNCTSEWLFKKMHGQYETRQTF